VGWTSIYQLFWCSPGVQGFDTLPYDNLIWYLLGRLWLNVHECAMCPLYPIAAHCCILFGIPYPIISCSRYWPNTIFDYTIWLSRLSSKFYGYNSQ
jgi:hypothetical protein